MKRIHLVERGENGQIHKNESYGYLTLLGMVIQDKYFKGILGYFRRKTAEKVFDRLSEITDLDKKGRHRVERF